MAYNPVVWATGDTITAEKLNKMEQGIADAGSLKVYTFTQNSGQDTYCVLTQAETQEMLGLIENHELFMINVKYVNKDAPTPPIAVTGYGLYNDKLSLDHASGFLAPSGVSGLPYYDEAQSLFVWKIYVD